MKTSWAIIIGFCAAVLNLSVGAYCADDTTRHIIHLGWEHDFPPDMARYEVKCVPDDNSSIVQVPVDDPGLTISDANETGLKAFDWHGEAEVTRGRFECFVRAVDLAEQKSGWAGPVVRDLAPSSVIHLRFITSPEIKVEVTQ